MVLLLVYSDYCLSCCHLVPLGVICFHPSVSLLVSSTLTVSLDSSSSPPLLAAHLAKTLQNYKMSISNAVAGYIFTRCHTRITLSNHTLESHSRITLSNHALESHSRITLSNHTRSADQGWWCVGRGLQCETCSCRISEFFAGNVPCEGRMSRLSI